MLKQGKKWDGLQLKAEFLKRLTENGKLFFCRLLQHQPMTMMLKKQIK